MIVEVSNDIGRFDELDHRPSFQMPFVMSEVCHDRFAIWDHIDAPNELGDPSLQCLRIGDCICVARMAIQERLIPPELIFQFK